MDTARPIRTEPSPSGLPSAKAPPARERLGDRAPFRGRADEGPLALDAAVRGKLPAWLRGDLVRVVPAVFERTGWRVDHWFDALGALVSFRIDGSGVHFRQRLMETEVEKSARTGRSPRNSFGTPADRSFWSRAVSPAPAITDNANVNVVSLGDERVALTESPHQWSFDPETLQLRRLVAYEDGLGELAMLAHPHLDFARDRVVNVAPAFGAASGIVVYEHAPASRTRKLVGRVPVRRVPYLHAFGLTPRHVILIGHPFDVSSLQLLWSNRGYIDHFAWRPGEGTTLWLMDRATGAVRGHSAAAGFVFHVVNAFEEDGDTVIDVALFPDASIVGALRTATLLRDGLPDLAPSIVRWRLTPGREPAAVETLLGQGFEFPTVAYRLRSGQRHTVAWGARISDLARRSEIVRLDERGGTRVYSEPGVVLGEPVLVSAPSATREDDAVLLSVGAAAQGDRSVLVVLDAATLEPLAHAEVPLPIPLGFHGSFFRAPGT
jgi:carotenoid cleavage dioxygenase-like enzyme